MLNLVSNRNDWVQSNQVHAEHKAKERKAKPSGLLQKIAKISSKVSVFFSKTKECSVQAIYLMPQHLPITRKGFSALPSAARMVDNDMLPGQLNSEVGKQRSLNVEDLFRAVVDGNSQATWRFVVNAVVSRQWALLSTVDSNKNYNPDRDYELQLECRGPMNILEILCEIGHCNETKHSAILDYLLDVLPTPVRKQMLNRAVQGKTALTLAMKHKHPVMDALVKKMLHVGADLFVEDRAFQEKINVAFNEAVKWNNYEAVQQQLLHFTERHKLEIYKEVENSISLVPDLCRIVANYAVDNAPLVNSINHDRWPPLQEAIFRATHQSPCSLNMIQLLLEHGATVGKAVKWNDRMLHKKDCWGNLLDYAKHRTPGHKGGKELFVLLSSALETEKGAEEKPQRKKRVRWSQSLPAIEFSP